MKYTKCANNFAADCEPPDNKPISAESLKKKLIFEKLMDTLKSEQAAESTGNSWDSIKDT